MFGFDAAQDPFDVWLNEGPGALVFGLFLTPDNFGLFKAFQLFHCGLRGEGVELFETQEMAGDVETSGELTAGTTVFDRRPKTQWRPNMDVATGVDVAGVKDCLARGLNEAGNNT